MNLKAWKNNMGKEHMLCDSPFRILKFTFMLLCKSKVVLEGFGGCWIWAQNRLQIWLYNVMEMAYASKSVFSKSHETFSECLDEPKGLKK